MSYSTTARIFKRPALLAMLLTLPLPAFAAEAPVEVNVSGGVVHKIHGVEEINPQLFGADRGSGGIAGWKEANVQWFRSTSVIPMPGLKEDPKNPGHPDPAWLDSTFPTKGTSGKKDDINMIHMFFPGQPASTPAWFGPLDGRTGNPEASKAFGEVAARVVASELRPSTDGSKPQTMFEMGNEMMYTWIVSPFFKMDSTRFSPASYGDNDAKAYTQWVYYTSKAIKEKTPNAKILGGAGDMALAAFDWWGWDHWDKPFLDQCTPYIDYYVTHFYDVDPMEIVLEAGLVRAYTDKKFGKPLSSQITESGLAVSGPEAPMNGQWSRLQYSGSLKFAALRDPDKLSGIYDFLWAAKETPYWTIRGSLLEKWLRVTSDLRGQTILAQSSSASIMSAATQAGNSLVAVAENFGAASESVHLNITAPTGRKITEYQITSFNYDASSDKPDEETRSIELPSAPSQVSCPVTLSPGGTVAITAKLDGQVAADKVVSTDEFTSDQFLVPAGQPIQVNVTKKSAGDYALLRIAVENKTSHWSDVWVRVNDQLYQLPSSLWRRPLRSFDVPVDRSIIKDNNTIVLLADPSSQIRAVTTAIELSDVPMTNEKPHPTAAMAQLRAPATTLQGGQTYPVRIDVWTNRASNAAGTQSVDSSRIVWSLPDGWEIKPSSAPNAQYSFELKIPNDAVVDWYPISAKVDLSREQIALNSQVHVSTPIECTEFKTAPKIDGDLSEWTDHKPYEILTPIWQYQRLMWMPGHREYQHTGKSMRFGWSKDGFYFAAEIAPRKPFWADKWNHRKHDWIDLYFDLLDEREWFKFGRDDYQFGIVLGEKGEAVVSEPIWVGAAPKYTVKPLPGAVAKWMQKQDGPTVVEGFIPAAAFEAWDPKQVSKIGFDFRVTDPFDWYGRGYETALDQLPTAYGWGQEQVMTCPALWAGMQFK